MAVPRSFPNWLIVRLWVPIARNLFAGRRWFPMWGVLTHRGRRTGRALAVPVAVLARPDGFVIPLLFGPGTNWVRNVLAAGGCVVRWRGVDHRMTRPELIGHAQARAYFGRFAWRASETLVGPESFLLLRRCGAGEVVADRPDARTAP
jgi:deazaflavin-dependent oxidoreductase (nitroreductase family)